MKRKNRVILLMITDGKEWHYIAVKRLPALFRKIISKRDGDSYCLNCFHSYIKKGKLEKHKDVCEKYDYYYVQMPNEDNKIFKYNIGQKSMKVPFIFYADLESLLKKNEHLS